MDVSAVVVGREGGVVGNVGVVDVVEVGGCLDGARVNSAGSDRRRDG